MRSRNGNLTGRRGYFRDYDKTLKAQPMTATRWVEFQHLAGDASRGMWTARMPTRGKCG